MPTAMDDENEEVDDVGKNDAASASQTKESHAAAEERIAMQRGMDEQIGGGVPVVVSEMHHCVVLVRGSAKRAWADFNKVLKSRLSDFLVLWGRCSSPCSSRP